MKTPKAKIAIPVVACLVAVCLAACGKSSPTASGGGGNGKAVSLRWADSSLQGTPEYDGAEDFATAAHSNSGGTITVKHFPNGQLGAEDSELQSIRSGAVDMGSLSSQVLASLDPQFGVFSAPYLFTSLGAVQKYTDSAAGHKLLGSLEKYGLHGITLEVAGFSAVISKTPIKSGSDFQGMKVRVLPSPIERATMEALGGTPVGVDATALYLALQQHTVDAVVASTGYILSSKLGEVAKYLTRLNYEVIAEPVVMNLDKWKSLSPKQQAAITKAGQKAQKTSFSVEVSDEQKALSALKAQHVQIISQLSDQSAVAAKVRKAVFPKLSTTLGGTVLADAQKAVGAS